MHSHVYFDTYVLLLRVSERVRKIWRESQWQRRSTHVTGAVNFTFFFLIDFHSSIRKDQLFIYKSYVEDILHPWKHKPIALSKFARSLIISRMFNALMVN